MTTIAFHKMQGSGNDFIMIDNRSDIVPHEKKLEFVKRFCPRATAVGADGVIFIEEDVELDFCWSFWNADGSQAEMCGNGARCAAVFANSIGAAGYLCAGHDAHALACLQCFRVGRAGEGFANLR